MSTRIKLELTGPAQTFIKIEVAFPQIPRVSYLKIGKSEDAVHITL